MIGKIISISVIIFFVFITTPIISAQDEGQDANLKKAVYFDYGFKEFGLFSGFCKGHLKEKEDYELIPAMLHFGFDLRPVIKNKSNILFEFSLEPFINTVISPDYNIEIGNNFLFKFALPFKERFYPYIEGGLGIIYLSQHTREQDTQFNFTLFWVLGLIPLGRTQAPATSKIKTSVLNRLQRERRTLFAIST